MPDLHIQTGVNQKNYQKANAEFSVKRKIYSLGTPPGPVINLAVGIG